MVVRVMVGGHQDPTGVLQVDLVEQHLGKWLMGGEEGECGWRKRKERWECNGGTSSQRGRD